ncbi:MAG: Phosphoglycolate phosphatase (EC [uncultured Sulfurovum sp.]|uniref:Phosphoglycolate phosphatase n=1 Tax=uncultured Sulfurovum sp. TaxID=269237 RepID=A0A6S6SVS1_9BACT|nr:MAG: Phosphoglycolate phosphatase (EC [uncultured Sulfurovum sp.]
MKFSNKKVIIFDLDGTLIDSSPDLALAINHMLKNIGRETFTLDEIHHWVGNGAEILVKRALSGSSKINSSIEPKEFEIALDIFLKFYAKNLAVETITYPHVLSTLTQLKEQGGYKLAIVTNKPFDFVEPILNALKLKEYFEFHLGGDSLKDKKPNPAPLLYVCDKLNVTVDECIMVGDSKNDILAAKACRMQSIGLTYGYNYGEPISKHNPDVYFSDFSEISKLLC